MRARAAAVTGIGLLGFGGPFFAQTPANVDFVRDVQPIFQQSCIGCHGPAQQQNGLRLDVRRDAMRGGTIASSARATATAAGSISD
jgi:mono/diheme cytochrome c family protein